MAVLGNKVIKSIQRGYTSISASSDGDVSMSGITINAVDLTKSFVSISFSNGYGVGDVSNNMTGPYTGPTSMAGQLIGSTTIAIYQGRWQRYNNTYASAGGTAYWEVIEYA
jgi:hypothetical protein